MSHLHRAYESDVSPFLYWDRYTQMPHIGRHEGKGKRLKGQEPPPRGIRWTRPLTLPGMSSSSCRCIGVFEYMFNVYKMVDISIMVMCDASDMIRYGRRTPELTNAPIHVK